MKCPKCQSEVKQVHFDEFEVDQCQGCGGLWFDLLEAEKLQKRKGSEALDRSAAHAERSGDSENEPRADALICPRCLGHTLTRMAVRGQPHILYERCAVCHGVFFDPGEFRDLKELGLRERIRAMMRG